MSSNIHPGQSGHRPVGQLETYQQSQLSPSQTKANETEKLRAKITSILAATANGCLDELGLKPNMPRLIAEYQKKNDELRTANDKLFQDNTRLYDTVKKQSERLTWLAQSPDDVKAARIIALEKELRSAQSERDKYLFALQKSNVPNAGSPPYRDLVSHYMKIVDMYRIARHELQSRIDQDVTSLNSLLIPAPPKVFPLIQTERPGGFQQTGLPSPKHNRQGSSSKVPTSYPVASTGSRPLSSRSAGGNTFTPQNMPARAPNQSAQFVQAPPSTYHPTSPYQGQASAGPSQPTMSIAANIPYQNPNVRPPSRIPHTSTSGNTASQSFTPPTVPQRSFSPHAIYSQTGQRAPFSPHQGVHSAPPTFNHTAGPSASPTFTNPSYANNTPPSTILGVPMTSYSYSPPSSAPAFQQYPGTSDIPATFTPPSFEIPPPSPPPPPPATMRSPSILHIVTPLSATGFRKTTPQQHSTIPAKRSSLSMSSTNGPEDVHKKPRVEKQDFQMQVHPPPSEGLQPVPAAPPSPMAGGVNLAPPASSITEEQVQEGGDQEEGEEEEEEDDEEPYEVGPDGLVLISYCLEQLFEDTDEGKSCRLCAERHLRGFSAEEPQAFVDPTEDELVAHCTENHLGAWESLRGIENSDTVET